MAARLRIIAGNRYIRRDGKISGKIRYNNFAHPYPFYDEDSKYSYSLGGKSYKYYKLPEDLIRQVDVIHKEDITEWL